MDKETAIEKIWPSILKELSGKKLSYAMGGHAYPNNKAWSKTTYEKLYIILEDPNRPPKPNYDPVFDAWFDFTLQNKQLYVDFNLMLEVPITVDVNEVLSIIDHPYIGQSPTLSIQNTHRSGKRYSININGNSIYSLEMGVSDITGWITKRIDILEAIVEILYQIEKEPSNNSLFSKLRYWLVEI